MGALKRRSKTSPNRGKEHVFGNRGVLAKVHKHDRSPRVQLPHKRQSWELPSHSQDNEMQIRVSRQGLAKLELKWFFFSRSLLPHFPRLIPPPRRPFFLVRPMNGEGVGKCRSEENWRPFSTAPISESNKMMMIDREGGNQMARIRKLRKKRSKSVRNKSWKKGGFCP